MLLTSGSDGALNFISNAGTMTQAVRSITLNDGTSHSLAGLDDALFPTSTNGTLFITDTSNNRVLEVSASGLDMNSLLAADSGVEAIGVVNPTNGFFTSAISGLSGPHGLAFVASPEPGSAMLLFGGGLLGVGAYRAMGAYRMKRS